MLTFWILFAAVCARLTLLFTYYPWVCGDTPGYTRLTNIYRGGRTPGYFLFLLVTSPGDKLGYLSSVIAQCILGICLSVMAFDLVRRITGNRWLAFAAGLWNALYLKQGQMEMCLLPESLSTFLFMLLTYSFPISAKLQP
jgi:hypothetical protein